MTLSGFRRSRAARLFALALTICVLATILPVRSARADYAYGASTNLTPASLVGSGGSFGSAGNPSGNSVEALATVNEATGTATAGYSFKLPKARGDAQPSLSLQYSSGSGVGFAGMGWSLNVSTIARKGHQGMPAFIDQVLVQPTTLQSDPASDDYYIDGRLLVPISQTNRYLDHTGERFPPIVQQPGWIYFRAEVEDGARYFFNGGTWLIQTKSGHLLQFGYPIDANNYPIQGVRPAVEIVDQVTFDQIAQFKPGADPIFRWNLVSDADASGNTVYYQWDTLANLYKYNGTAPNSNPAGTLSLTDIYDTSPPGAANVDLTTFAHHTHLTWSLPVYPGFFTMGNVGINPMQLQYSPIWKAPPFAQLTNVDVMSATWNSTQRQLVRSYRLGYDYNQTQTRSYLTSIVESGDCDSVGSLAETGTWPMNTSSCAHRPPTTYSYSGVSPVPTGTVPVPAIVQKTPTFTVPPTDVAPGFLLDLNGDGASELITTSFGIEQAFLNAGSASGAPVTGPGQTGAQYPVTSTNGPYTTVSVDDWMWMYAAVGDWASSARPTLLQLIYPAWNSLSPFPPKDFNYWVPYPLNNGSGAGTNSNPAWIYQGQLQQEGIGYTMQPSPLPADDQTRLTNLIGSFVLAPGWTPPDFDPQHVIDVDGDGLPDMALAPTTVPGQQYWDYKTSLTVRDRAGLTHPFLKAVQWVATSTMDQFDAPGAPQGDSSCSGRTPSPACSYPGTYIADIDGDGLRDLVTANKYGAFWGTTAPLDFLGFSVSLNRGDGRFGIPSQIPLYGQPTDSYVEQVQPGFSAAIDPNRTPPMSIDTMQQGQTIFGDLTGDGFDDFATLDSEGLHICIRYGAWWDTPMWQCVTDDTLVGTDQSKNGVLPNLGHDSGGFPEASSPDSIPQARIMIGDLDGSGINQLVYFPAGPTTGAHGTCNHFPNPGNVPPWFTPCPFMPPDAPATAVLMSPNGASTRRGGPNLPPRDGLLQTVSNGQGATTSFTYGTVHSLGIGSIPVPAWVVTETSTTNGLGGAQATSVTTRYTYESPVYDPRDRVFAGFRAVTARQIGGTNATGGVVRTTFATGSCADTATCTSGNVDYSYYHATRGLPVLTEISDETGHHWSSTWHEYTFYNWYGIALDGRGIANPALYREHEYLWGDDQASGTVNVQVFNNTPGPDATIPIQVPTSGSVLLTQRTVDKFNNEITSVDFGVVGKDQAILTSRSWGLPPGDTTGWSFRNTSSQVGYTADGATFSETPRQYSYGYTASGLLSFLSASLNGTVALPSRSAPQPADAVVDNPSLTLRQIDYDAYGNVTTVWSGLGPNDAFKRCVRIRPDGYYAQYPASVTAFPGGCDNGLGLTSYLAFDRRLDLLRMSIAPDGTMILRSYDEFGRLAEIDQPSASSIWATSLALKVVGYSDSGPVHSVHFQTVDGGGTQSLALVDHYRYFDGLGDQLEAIDEAGSAESPQWIVSGMHTRDSLGRMVSATKPFFSAQGDPGGTPFGVLPVAVAPTATPASGYTYD